MKTSLLFYITACNFNELLLPINGLFYKKKLISKTSNGEVDPFL